MVFARFSAAWRRFGAGALLLATAPLAVAADPAVSAGAAQALPALDAHVRYDSSVIDHAGVTKTAHYEERLIRRPGHVWIERILPPHVYREHDAAGVNEHVGHAHFDADLAAQSLSLDADGQMRAEFVDREHRFVVFVPPPEYSAVGLSAGWRDVNSLVDPAAVAKMQRSHRASPVAGAVWYEEHKGQWYSRVLWSEAQQIALLIESGDELGTVRRRTEVQLEKPRADAELPWRHLDGYVQHDYDDFLD